MENKIIPLLIRILTDINDIPVPYDVIGSQIPSLSEILLQSYTEKELEKMVLYIDVLYENGNNILLIETDDGMIQLSSPITKHNLEEVAEIISILNSYFKLNYDLSVITDTLSEYDDSYNNSIDNSSIENGIDNSFENIKLSNEKTTDLQDL